MSQKLLKIGNSNFRIKYENTFNELDMDTFVNGDDTKTVVSGGSSKQTATANSNSNKSSKQKATAVVSLVSNSLF